jgi:DMSO reductase anchor subunit
MGLHAAGLVFFDVHLAPLGWLGAALSIGTVFTTAMIYTQIRAVPRWNQWATPVMFLACALAGGALLSGQERLSGWLFLIAGAVILWHWWKGDRRLAEAGTTLGTATGLGGDVSTWERPHTGDNYVTREMAFRVARRHAVKLRVIGLALASVVPAALVLVPLELGFAAKHALAGVALLLHLAGVLVTRWLFFAEAEHVVGFYYGAGANVPAAQG